MQKGQRAATFDRHRRFYCPVDQASPGDGGEDSAVSWQKNSVRGLQLMKFTKSLYCISVLKDFTCKH
jgi:hypothetical protein